MKSEIKCYRCGKIYVLNYKTLKEVISCGHCHQQMKITVKTQKKLRLMRYMFVFVICMVIAYMMSNVSDNSLFLLLITLSIAMILANFSDRLCLYLTDRIFNLEYEEYHPEVKTKKEIRKEKSKKKGLFNK